MNSELEGLLLMQMEQLIEQNKLLNEQNQLLAKKNQLLQIENQNIKRFNQDMQDSAKTWQIQAEQFKTLNMNSIDVIHTLMQSQTHHSILDSIMKNLSEHLKTRVLTLEEDLLVSMQPKIQQVISETMERNLKHMIISLEQDHLDLKRQIRSLSNAL